MNPFGLNSYEDEKYLADSLSSFTIEVFYYINRELTVAYLFSASFLTLEEQSGDESIQIKN